MGDLVSEWINRGKQRRAVYRALSYPRTGRQILLHARQIAPRITFQDVRHVLRDLERRGGVRCINPNVQTGRVYVQAEFDLSSIEVDWAVYASVARAKARSIVLLELGLDRFGLLHHPKTATGIKRRLRNEYPMSLNMTIEILQDLVSRGLVSVVDHLRKGDCKVYGLTEAGRGVVKVLNRAAGSSSSLG